jgi:hypothetical protein
MSYDPRMQPRPMPPRELPPAALKVAFGCVGLFLIPFILAGLSVIGAGIAELHKNGWQQAVVPLIGGSVFLLFPLLFGGILFYALRAAMRQAALRGAKPNEPWLWREDWAQGYARDRLSAGSAFLFVFAIIWNLISGVAFYVIWRSKADADPSLLFVAVFPLIGLGLLLAAIYQFLRERKYGRSICRLQQIPIEPGRAFSGELETHVLEAPENGFVLRLSCVQRVQSGKNTHESTLWSEETTISRGAVIPTPDGMRVPFTLMFPADAAAKNDPPRGTIVWRLKATADVPGVDYAAEFELPVFATAR